ncbi:Protein of unknown function [Spirosomataceae bacterium TFI 002]|nr:Protein of unknown function [Spirosomataceae bacterium TFI 002]
MSFKRRLTILLILTSQIAVSQTPFKVLETFEESPVPPEPQYSLEKYWCALPQKKDQADKVPVKSDLKDGQDKASADVFFIHPTIFTYEPQDEYKWNGNVNDEKLNQKVDESTILNQASVFNGSCKVYAPRYRQAHYSAFTTDLPSNKKKSLDLAYADVKAAFEYYLANWNEGRPIVIASHSQGTIHAGRLLKEFFEGKELQKQLVEAYLIGIATPTSYFDDLQLSTRPDHVGGFVTWNTFHKGYVPDYYDDGLDIAACINPLTWSNSEEWVSRKENKGGVGLKFKFVKKMVGAQVNDGMLWVNKPNLFLALFLNTKIWHVGDINLFWNNIRDNVALRIDRFNEQTNEK